MSDLVVDSSVVAKWILPESDSFQAQHLITEAMKQESKLFVLDLAFVEVANAIWKRRHQRLISTEEAESFLTALRSCPVHSKSANELLPQALRIAMKYDRSVYDALFVALAVELQIAGVTADAPLINALRGDFPQIQFLAPTGTP